MRRANGPRRGHATRKGFVLWKSCFFILRNVEMIHQVLHRNIADILSPSILHCISAASVLYPIFICFSIAIKKLEHNSSNASDIIPTVFSLFRRLDKVAEIFPDLAEIIEKAKERIHIRFFKSIFCSIYYLAFAITPQGRNYVRSHILTDFDPDTKESGGIFEPENDFSPSTEEIITQIIANRKQWADVESS